MKRERTISAYNNKQNFINIMRKKFMLWVMTATLLSGASVFTSCTTDNKDNVVPVNDLAEQLVGKWLYNEADGHVVETAESSITTFVKEGKGLKAYLSVSLKKYGLWAYKQPADVKIDGNKLTVTLEQGDAKTVEEYTDITVSGDNLYYTSMYTAMRNGKVIDVVGPYRLHCTKVKAKPDYASIFTGRWEGTITSDEPGFKPQPFCEEYLADGSNIAYELSDGQWVPVKGYDGEFFIDGNLLCTRWNSPEGEDQRTNCIFESYNNGTMILKEVVLRDGKPYTETSTLTKVN